MEVSFCSVASLCGPLLVGSSQASGSVSKVSNNKHFYSVMCVVDLKA